MNRTLKIISLLLSYPSPELQAGRAELKAALEGEKNLSPGVRRLLDKLVDYICTADLYEAQERYVHLFDRTRSLSLHLFEHVHGESRDRGQAMVDLGQMYEDNASISTPRNCQTICRCSSNSSPRARPKRFTTSSPRRATSRRQSASACASASRPMPGPSPRFFILPMPSRTRNSSENCFARKKTTRTTSPHSTASGKKRL
ncbi:nitrate reductase 1, delta subunit [Brucella ceti TE28753-12]|nr:nitrate reductase 1, delta subunit [Brucella ceti TE28753-12]